MNQKQWKLEAKNPQNRKTFFFYRNLAVKYFNLKSGEVIHHKMYTEEQRKFNTEHYERWGFDFDGQMKFCEKMTKEEHDTYHVNLRKEKPMTDEHKRRLSESLKAYNKKPESKIVQRISREKQWDIDGAHERQTKALQNYFSDPNNRKRLSNSMQGLKLWTDGKIYKWSKECPNGFYKAESPNKGKHWHQKNYKEQFVECIETGEIFEKSDVIKKYPNAMHFAEVANGRRHSAGGFHWRWIEKQSV
jgi:hypothetical protein